MGVIAGEATGVDDLCEADVAIWGAEGTVVAISLGRPRKSPTLRSTNWLIEIWLVSQYAFRRS